MSDLHSCYITAEGIGMLGLRLDHLELLLQEEFRYFGKKILRPFAAEADRIADVPAELSHTPEVISFMRAHMPEEMSDKWPGLLHKGKRYDLSSSVKLRMIIGEEMGYGDASLYLALPGPALAEPIVKRLGSPEQIKRLFGIFLESVPKWAAFAMTEPNAGSDVTAMTTTARRENKSYVINGRKWFIGNGARADWVVVFATINSNSGPFGIRPFIVTRGTPGFRIGRILPSMGLRALQISELIFEDCRISAENLLGGDKFEAKRSGFRAGLQVFDVMRPVVGALAVGIARAAIDYLEEGAKTDRASHFQARSWLEMDKEIGAMKPGLQAARLLCWKAAWLYDNGRDNTREAAAAKVLASRTAISMCSRALDLARRANLSNQLALEKLCRDVRAFDFLEGTEDVLKLSIAKTLAR
jgi:acyl-CoA dehydrogenase